MLKSYIILNKNKMCKSSFYANGRSGYRAFIKGIGSIINMAGNDPKYIPYSSPYHADYAALNNDWKMIGFDIKVAMKSHSKDHNLVLNETK